MAKKQHGQPGTPHSGKQEGRGNWKKRLPLLALGFALEAVCFLLCAVLTLHSDASKSSDYYRVIGSLCVGAFSAAYFAARKEKQHGLLTGFFTLLPVHVLFCGVSLLFGKGSADLTILLSFLMLSLVSMLGGVLGVNKREKPKKQPSRR